MTAASPNEIIGQAARLPLADDSTPDADLSWHRLAAGGLWSEEGAWVVDFLKRQGLRSDHYVLEVGCGSLSAASRLLPYMQQSHYWGFEKNMELYLAGSQIELPRAGVQVDLGHFIVNDDFDLSSALFPFDLAIASSFFRRLPLNSIARCLAAVIKKLAPGGRFYVTWPDNADPAEFGPMVQPDGTTTYSDRDPFYYNFSVLAALVDAIGGQAERLDDRSHPRREAVMVVTRR
jgi:SAM-dependent methyltransferase